MTTEMTSTPRRIQTTIIPVDDEESPLAFGSCSKSNDGNFQHSDSKVTQPSDGPKAEETIRLEVEIIEPTEESCMEVSYVELAKKHLLCEKSETDPFAAQDAQEEDRVQNLVKSLEEKYGHTGNVRDLVDMGEGYDVDDSFIDNTDAYDEVVPESLTTWKGGFYINRGILDFKPVKVKPSANFGTTDKPTFSSTHSEDSKQKVVSKLTASDSSDDEPLIKKADNSVLKTNNIKRQRLKKKKKSLALSLCKGNGGLSALNAGKPGQVKVRLWSDPEIISKLPADLPVNIRLLLANLKRIAKNAYETESRLFTKSFNKQLLNLDQECLSQISSGSRSLLYSHLSAFLPCSKESLLRRLNRLRKVARGQEKCSSALDELKKALDVTMTTQLAKYEAKIASYEVQKESARKSVVSEAEIDLKDGGRVDADISGDFPVKPNSTGLKWRPKKRFQWTTTVRSLFLSVIRQKFAVYKSNKHLQQTKTAEEYVSEIIENEIRPLWPAGWMRNNLLLREAKTVVEEFEGSSTTHTTATHPVTSTPTCRVVDADDSLNSKSVVTIHCMSPSKASDNSSTYPVPASPITAAIEAVCNASSSISPPYTKSKPVEGGRSKIRQKVDRLHNQNKLVNGQESYAGKKTSTVAVLLKQKNEKRREKLLKTSAGLQQHASGLKTPSSLQVVVSSAPSSVPVSIMTTTATSFVDHHHNYSANIASTKQDKSKDTFTTSSTSTCTVKASAPSSKPMKSFSTVSSQDSSDALTTSILNQMFGPSKGKGTSNVPILNTMSVTGDLDFNKLFPDFFPPTTSTCTTSSSAVNMSPDLISDSPILCAEKISASSTSTIPNAQKVPSQSLSSPTSNASNKPGSLALTVPLKRSISTENAQSNSKRKMPEKLSVASPVKSTKHVYSPTILGEKLSVTSPVNLGVGLSNSTTAIVDVPMCKSGLSMVASRPSTLGNVGTTGRQNVQHSTGFAFPNLRSPPTSSIMTGIQQTPVQFVSLNSSPTHTSPLRSSPIRSSPLRTSPLRSTSPIAASRASLNFQNTLFNNPATGMGFNSTTKDPLANIYQQPRLMTPTVANAANMMSTTNNLGFTGAVSNMHGWQEVVPTAGSSMTPYASQSCHRPQYPSATNYAAVTNATVLQKQQQQRQNISGTFYPWR